MLRYIINDGSNSGCEDNSIFAFQRIDIDGVRLNIFYDTGCGDLVISKEAVDKLKRLGRAKIEFVGPIVLNGVSNQESVSEYGIYSVRLPLENGSEATMSGVCVS